LATVPTCPGCIADDNAYFTACNCSVVNVADAPSMQATYNPALRQLWVAVPADVNQSELLRVPHRIVRSVNYPAGQTAFLFVATGLSG